MIGLARSLKPPIAISTPNSSINIHRFPRAMSLRSVLYKHRGVISLFTPPPPLICFYKTPMRSRFQEEIHFRFHVIFCEPCLGRQCCFRKAKKEMGRGEAQLHSREVNPQAHWRRLGTVTDPAIRPHYDVYVPRLPPPKVRTDSFIALVACSHRPGSNLSGFGNALGSRCKLHAWVLTTVSAGR